MSILEAPLLSCVSMGVSAALLGVCLLYEKRALIGEVLSHAAYPGVVLGTLLSILGSFDSESMGMVLACVGAILSACGGAYLLKLLKERFRVSQDAALSFVLSSSFAVALLLISALETNFARLSHLLQNLLLGQVSTVSSLYATISVVFSCVVVVSFVFLARLLRAELFDREFVQIHGLRLGWLEGLVLVLLAVCVMLGIRTMGVILLSSAFIFPAISSRYLARSFGGQLVVAAVLGGAVSIGGIFLSYSYSFQAEERVVWLPTGPLIAILSMVVFLGLFFFSWKEGLFFRAIRSCRFSFRCYVENALKSLWKRCSSTKKTTLTHAEVTKCLSCRWCIRQCILLALWKKGYIVWHRKKVTLTPLGLLRGQKLVRLHRLWELYLVLHCGLSHQKVHPHAEEMEHVLTPEVERELDNLLQNPTRDPHSAPIPPSFDELFLHEGAHP